MPRTSHPLRTLCCAAPILCALAPASATNTYLQWREIDTSAATPGVSGWQQGNRTFDLYLLAYAGGNALSVVDAGSFPSSPTLGIRIVGGQAYNHPFGINTRLAPVELFPGFTELRFDTFCCFGGNPAPGGPDGTQTSFLEGPPDLVGATGKIMFASISAPQAPIAPDPTSPYGGSIRVLRITVTPGTRQLGGGDSLVRIYQGGPGDSLVPYAFPPDAPTLLSPVPAAHCVHVSPALTFAWAPAAYAQSYDFTLAADPAFQTILFAVSNLTTLSQPVSPWTVERGETYYWRVTAYNTAGQAASDAASGVFATVPAGDVNQDGAVYFDDLNAVLSAFGAHLGNPAYLPQPDLNHDGVIDFLDLNIVLSAFGNLC